MIAPLWSLRRLGIQVTAREASSYQAVWKHVGFYLGMQEDLLEKFYGGSHDLAEESFACLAFDAFPDEIPIDGFNTPTYQILNAGQSTFPFPFRFPFSFFLVFRAKVENFTY